MNTPELFYKSITFFFSNLWIYLGLLLLILTIRGDVTKAYLGINKFFKAVTARYKTKLKEQEILDRTKH